MPIRTAEEASAELGHHFDGLRTVGIDVLDQFRAECRGIAPIILARTRASIMRDLFLRKFREYCDATDGAHYYRRNQLELVGLESRWVMRVKQLAHGFTVGVSPTRASEQYDANQMPSYAANLFPEAPQATLLYFGWSIPENAPNQLNLYLVCNDQNRNVMWVIDLNDGEGDGRGLQMPLPETGDNEGVGVRIKVKRDEQKANG